MGDANVRRPVATRFEHGLDFGLLVHKSPFMADKRDPLVLSNYIFELLEVNPGVAGFLIQLHPDDVDAVVESVTAHAEKGAGTKTTLYVGQEEEEEEVEEEEEDAGGVGAGGRKEKPHNPLMISVHKVRIRPGKGKGQSDGWFPQPLTHNTRRVCTDARCVFCNFPYFHVSTWEVALVTLQSAPSGAHMWNRRSLVSSDCV